MSKYIFATLLVLMQIAVAQQQTQVNFNLVQVNNYPGQTQATQNIAAPGPRIVIDPMNPNAVNYLYSATSAPGTAPVMQGGMDPRLLQAASASMANLGHSLSVPVPWESSTILVSPTGVDSFLVRSSKTGCPGTEVRPSVSVAFASGGGWSDPPIRFGPLTAKTICALGGGAQLEVSQIGNSPPSVRLVTSSRK